MAGDQDAFVPSDAKVMRQTAPHGAASPVYFASSFCAFVSVVISVGRLHYTVYRLRSEMACRVTRERQLYVRRVSWDHSSCRHR
jgi:hypothetical protein